MTKCILYGMLTNGVYANMHDSSRRVYDPGGVSPTITTMGGGNLEPKIVEPVLVGGVGEINFGSQYRQGNRIYDSEAIAMALMAQPVGNAGGNSYLYRVTEPTIAAMRGRNPENPTSRESGLPTQQMLEIKNDGTANTLTTVQKDNLVIEPQVLTPKRTEHGKAVRKAYESGAHQESRHTMTELEPRTDGISNTLTTVQKDNLVIEPSGIYTGVTPEFQRGPLEGISRTLKAVQHDAGVVLNYRVRKLTPKECWRVMGFTDQEFEESRIALNKTFYKGRDKSKSRLYKQAGNSIVKQVLMAIFGEMIG